MSRIECESCKDEFQKFHDKALSIMDGVTPAQIEESYYGASSYGFHPCGPEKYVLRTPKGVVEVYNCHTYHPGGYPAHFHNNPYLKEFKDSLRMDKERYERENTITIISNYNSLKVIKEMIPASSKVQVFRDYSPVYKIKGHAVYADLSLQEMERVKETWGVECYMFVVDGGPSIRAQVMKVEEIKALNPRFEKI